MCNITVFSRIYIIIKRSKKVTKNRNIIFSLKMKKTLVFSENIGYNILCEKNCQTLFDERGASL